MTAKTPRLSFAGGILIVLLQIANAAPASVSQSPGYVGLFPDFDGSFVIVSSVADDSPAADNDILAGDKILTVNGIYPTSEAHYRQLTAGPTGTELTMTIFQPDGTNRTVSMIKRPVKEPPRYFGVFGRKKDAVVTEFAATEAFTSKEIPKGLARARGRVLLDGRPWAEALIAVRVYTNESRTAFVKTNEAGVYSVAIPTGTVPVLGFWLQRPPTFDDKVLMTGATEWTNVACSGKSCRLPTVKVATAVEMTRPAKRALFEERKVEFAWKPMEGAASYEIDVAPTSKADPGWAEHRLVRTVTEPEFCCYEIPDKPSSPRHVYYSWSVTALSPKGGRLSKTGPGAGSFVFKRATREPGEARTSNAPE